MNGKNPKRNKKYRAPKPVAEKRQTRPHCSFCGGIGLPGESARNIETKIGTRYRVPMSHQSCANSLSLSLQLEPSA